jgi:hypothetical protein
MVGAMGNRPQC